MRQRESHEFLVSSALWSPVRSLPRNTTHRSHCSKHATWEQGPVQKHTKYRLCLKKKSPPRASCRYISSVGHKAFQVAPVPEGLQSMSALLVCAVMAHLEYNRHSWLDKARLVCLCALVSLLSLLFYPFLLFFCPLPCVKIPPPPPHSSTCLLYVRSICLCQLPLMVPSSGSFVSTLNVIAILCETKKRWN